MLVSTEDGLRVLPTPSRCLTTLYRCGAEPYLEPLRAMEDGARGPWLGMILIDQKEATISRFRGAVHEVLWHSDWSGVPPKHAMGGQSQHRFQANHANAVLRWLREVADRAKESFLSRGVRDLVLAGPGFCKRDLLKDGGLDYRFRVVRVVDQEYVDGVYGPRECLQRLSLDEEG